MTLMSTTATDTQVHELPEIADPSGWRPRTPARCRGCSSTSWRCWRKALRIQLRAEHADRDEHVPGPLRGRRFRGRGPEEMEDIVQVGMIGLIKAIDRFDLTREVEFTSFAIPYIVGEIKRFFRDTTWAVHVPRRLQEARVQLARATEELRSRLDAPRRSRNCRS